jgi:hypothetical protein
MSSMEKFLTALPEDTRQEIGGLDTPAKIQEMLDRIPYRTEDINCCPLSVFTSGKANCFDGALLAAACLNLLGYPPVIVEMVPWNDDDHILAIFKHNGRYGALAKSNFVGLRKREPVYKSLHELIMSYFDLFYNVDAEFTLRGYSAPLYLSAFDRFDWTCSDDGAEKIASHLSKIRRYSILTPDMIRELGKVDDLTYRTGLSIANPAGLFDPKKKLH